MMHDTVTTSLDCYIRQSPITDPRDYSSLFDGLPRYIPSLCRIVQGLLIHYEEGSMYDIEIPEERRREIDTRDVASMLARIQAMDDRPLVHERRPDHRLVGCCRDFATLFCAMLRHHGIPARVRFGFATYFQPDFNSDHVICEYWNEENGRWMLVDPEMDEAHCEMNHLTFDVRDVPRNRFVLAGKAWQMCRSDGADPDRFGVNPEIRGLWFIQTYLVHDLAALNSMELLCWDCWGLADSSPDQAATPEELAVLDRVAGLTLAGNDALPEVQATYLQDARLRVHPVLHSYSPTGARTVDLAAVPSAPLR